MVCEPSTYNLVFLSGFGALWFMIGRTAEAATKPFPSRLGVAYIMWKPVN